MRIAGHEIGRVPFICAELSVNHNGSIHRAMEMIIAAKTCGVDAVKFQTFRADDVCPPDQMVTYVSRGITTTEPRINIFKRAELPRSAWPILKAVCDREGVTFLSTPETPADLDVLLKVGIPAIKVGSDNLTNLPMLRACARDDVGLPVILSCGMSDLAEVRRAVHIIGEHNVALLCCTSHYPTLPTDANLSRILTLRGAFPDVPIGLSDHTQGTTAAAAAVPMGACIFESHFTLSHDLDGPEHAWARTPYELAQWVTAIRDAHKMLGDGIVRPSADELEVKADYQRNVQ